MDAEGDMWFKIDEWILEVSNEKGQGKTNAEGSTWFERKKWML
jgi:hypothetical protein